ncbi:hypothetical protein IAD21_01587 [Abditibacteriota bacterium]|nr:hypothetical protein IAD21_01587 [Abditibacteriota bacterium]
MPSRQVATPKTTISAHRDEFTLDAAQYNMGIKNMVVCGIFTDQCVSSAVQSLADDSFNVVVIHQACTAVTLE